MKTIGIIGGMSWESTESYYRLLNEGVKQRLGGLHSAKVLLHSVDFAEIEQLQHRGEWLEMATQLASAAAGLEKAGADFVLIATNTMHKVAPEVEQALTVPLLHIVDATAKQLKQDGVTTVGLLGTAFTMEQEFYRQRLEQNHGIQVLIPNQTQREEIHRVIYQELCKGQIIDESRQYYLNVINDLAGQGAQGVILGCTEIGLLVKPKDTEPRLYDTTELHANYALDHALSDSKNDA